MRLGALLRLQTYLAVQQNLHASGAHRDEAATPRICYGHLRTEEGQQATGYY